MDYSQELEDCIFELEKTSYIPDYFKNLFKEIEQNHAQEGRKRVGIIGDEFYSLYVRAFGLTPVLLNGGSFYEGENASHIFPQISDPIAKSTLGSLLNDEKKIFSNLDALLISASNDSYKKIIHYLEDLDLNIIKVEPPSYILEKMPFNYATSQIKVLNALSKVANTRFSSKKLKNELSSYKKAYEITQTGKYKAIPTFMQDFLLQTLYLENNKKLWLDEINKYLEKIEDLPQNNFFVLMGSGVKFPSSKIYKIFNEVGITHFENQCLDFPDYHKIPLKITSYGLLKECFKYQYKKTFSAATLSKSNNIIIPTQVKGIIYYLLKGQISEAYEAEQIEKVALSQSIPFLCIETDYTNTDNEQIKIRIEAFYEMLKNKSSV